MMCVRCVLLVWGQQEHKLKKLEQKIKSQVQYQFLHYKVVSMLKNFMEFIKL